MTLEGENAFMDKTHKTAIQAKVFDFALMDLVRKNRKSFLPIWTIDSWVKFLIWLAINCGCSGDREGIQIFEQSLGPLMKRKMRKIFFERILEDLSIYVIADPAESNVFLMPVDGQTKINFSDALQALEIVGLMQNVVLDQSTWKLQEKIISISWKSSESNG